MKGSSRPSFHASAPGRGRASRRRRVHAHGLVVACALGVLVSGCSGDSEGSSSRSSSSSSTNRSSSTSPSSPDRSSQVPTTPLPPAPSAGTENGATGGMTARLTPEYLAGVWCAVFSQERSRYVFGPDGSFRRALPGADFGAREDLEDLMEDFPVVLEVEADRFVLSRAGRGHREFVFSRGPC